MHGAKSIRVGSIGGIDIRVDWSVLAIVGLLIWSLAAAVLPDLAPDYSAPAYWAVAVLTVVGFFSSLLAHELNHCAAARRQGLHVRDVTLWLLGGVSTIEQEPKTAAGDFRIAIAGPAMSLALGLTFGTAAAVLAAAGAPDLVVAGAGWLAFVNIVLALFNLVPAAPLDGGRVLRAIRWRQTGDRTRAAIDAARAGRAFGVFLVALGFLEVLWVDFSGFWFVLLGWFLLSAARTEEMQARITHDLGPTLVRDLMTADPITVRADMTASEVLHDFVLTHHCSTFPVLDDRGELTGLVTLGRLRSVPAPQRGDTRISEIAWPRHDLLIAAPDEHLLDVLRRDTGGGDGRIIVCTDGAVVGIVSPSDITRALRVADIGRAA